MLPVCAYIYFGLLDALLRFSTPIHRKGEEGKGKDIRKAHFHAAQPLILAFRLHKVLFYASHFQLHLPSHHDTKQ